MKSKFAFLAPLSVTLLGAALRLFAAEPVAVQLPLDPGQLEPVPSFEACSFYFRAPAGAREPFVVEFRRAAGNGNWERALDPVCDRPADIWKGSVFNLTEDTVYELRVRSTAGAELIRSAAFRTWSSRPPIAKTIDRKDMIPKTTISQPSLPLGLGMIQSMLWANTARRPVSWLKAPIGQPISSALCPQ